MTVGELRKILDGIRDDVVVVGMTDSTWNHCIVLITAEGKMIGSYRVPFEESMSSINPAR
jgi:hypothetical protein